MNLVLDQPSGAAPEAPRRRLPRRQHLPLAVLLVVTAVVYLWGITRNGMGNDFYAASAWAGSQSWKALLFGSLDPGNVITVDKPPLSQWVMGLSAKAFGFSSASILIPQALMAVVSVGLMYGTVRRIADHTGAGSEASGPHATGAGSEASGPHATGAGSEASGPHATGAGSGVRSTVAGLIAGALLALTPVTALMFRFDNPDAAMVTLMIASAYFTVRAVQTDRRGGRWLALAGVALGFAFLAKMLEGLMVLPALGVVYLVAAPVALRRRLLNLVGAAAALVVSSGWYVVLTILWPASSRPYLAGSTNNTFMDLVLGYNGFGRLAGNNHHGGGRPKMSPEMVEMMEQFRRQMERSGGWSAFGGQAGAARLFTGEWGLEVSYLLPAALVALVFVLVSRGRAPRTDLMRAGALLFGLWTVIDAVVLSEGKAVAHAYYSLAVLPGIVGLVAIGGAEAWRRRDDWYGRAGMALMIVAAGGWGVVLLARESSYAPALKWCVGVATVLAAAAALVPPDAYRRARVTTVLGGIGLVVAVFAVFGATTSFTLTALVHPHTGGSPSVLSNRGFGGGGIGGARGHSASAGRSGSKKARDAAGSSGLAAWFGGSGDQKRIDAMLAGTNSEWAAAVSGSSQAAQYELATERPVIAIGGFTGQDPAPTLAQFAGYVRDHQVSYLIARSQSSGRGFGPGGRGNATTDEVTSWVEKYFPSSTVDGQTVYDLRSPTQEALAAA
ncbi:glycosyltransferase family 39 protein [Tsukamurella sp. 8F]|uniref:glycosyltransferase family 39 protein n=1 Tax=unclassified Tsukamurella TaxID=2633480 RepID=UPI0023B8AE5F|nr:MULTISPECIES: glycosyltransferase family 39 protein [unclassified Tsukamurella]MDF0528668.1 glycosyltransferase family 39 protein [Tsukamurella sp. 8J]MDF0585630.1 glycosyltransferase family 39 protein [Tsukamurella sp. 8F]